MNPDLERLISLQRIDSAIQDGQRRLAEEPERARQFEARLEEARSRVAAARERQTQSQGAKRELEKELAVQQGRLSKYRDQLMSVKTNVEYQAMQKEIEFAQHEIKALEDRMLELMLEADDLNAAVKGAEKELAGEQKAVEADQRKLTGELTALKGVVDGLTSERAQVVAAIDPKAIAVFDLVSRKRNGVGLAEARGGICTICHVRLRPQVFNHVLRNAEIIQCDSCNRILYFVPAPVTPPETADQSAQ